MGETIDYYNNNAESFTAGTIEVDFQETQEHFLGKLPAQGRILDFGCGSGRDTKYFMKRGFQVEAIDGSSELCRIASAFTGIQVKEMLFQDLEAVNCYDGIWACSSILHLPKNNLKTVMMKMHNALKYDGIIYASFKYGQFEGMRNGRYFTDFTEEAFKAFLVDIQGIKLEEYWITSDVRPGREEEKWLNLILRK